MPVGVDDEQEQAKEEALAPLARIPLEGGGFILVEAPGAAEGPVKAGRVSDAIHDLPGSLQGALEPVAEAARATLDQLRKVGPDGIAVEFGIDLAVEAGAVITKGSANCHLTVTLMWEKNRPGDPGTERSDMFSGLR